MASNLHVHNSRNVSVLEQGILNDQRISLEAIGLYAYLGLFPGGIAEEFVMSRFDLSRQKLNHTLAQLRSAGYIQPPPQA